MAACPPGSPNVLLLDLPWQTAIFRFLLKIKSRESDMRSSPAVRGRGIRKSFGDVVALDGVDLDVASGQVHGLVGPNGAGKTTLLGLLLGLAVTDSGSLEILGAPVGRTLAVPDGVAGFVDGPGLYPSLTARQNLSALASLRGYDAGRTAGVDDALEQVGLTDVADDRIRGFSLGDAPAAQVGRRAAHHAATARAR
jgi:ABC-2 type transport system ATP-binding protein